MSLGAGGQRPDGSDWQKMSLLAGGAGLWEWNHRNAVLRLCTGAAVILTDDASLAWLDLSLDTAFAKVHLEDLETMSRKLVGAAYPFSAQLARFRVRSKVKGTRRVLMRGRTQLDGGGEPSATAGVIVDITDAEIDEEAWFHGRADALDEAAQHGLAAYNAVQASGIAALVAPARTLLLEIGREIASGMKAGRDRPH